MPPLTVDQLRAATGCSTGVAGTWLRPLSDACRLYDITTPARLAAFLAQVAHESGDLHHVREIWGPTPAQQRYEGRADLGNLQPGDGPRYRGRGLLQITGRFNYAAARDRLRHDHPALDVPDFEAGPEQLEHPRWAAMSAAEYWARHGCNELADAGDFEAITRRINGGLNGLAARITRHQRAIAALSHPTGNGQGILDTSPPPDPPAAPVPAAPPVVPPAPPPPAAAPAAPAPKAPSIMAPFIAAALPLIVEAIPRLGKLFGSGSAVAQRNVAAAETVVQIVQAATGTPNAQAAAEAVRTDPAARQAAVEAIEARWYELTEAGGGGIDGARKADAAAAGRGDMLHSPSFWVTLALLPLVYLVVGSVVGLWGAAWPSDVRAAIATAVVSLIVGGAAGYYWGQTTTRNRTTMPQDAQ
jgi:putative chitinase